LKQVTETWPMRAKPKLAYDASWHYLNTGRRCFWLWLYRKQ